MVRHFAFAGLLFLVGCVDDYSPTPTSSTPVRRTPDPSAVCPGNDCVMMHSYNTPSKCAACATGGLPTDHHFCTDCAAKLERCAHCGRKKPAAPEGKKETPPPPEPAPPPEPKQQDPPKAPKFNLDDVKGDKLVCDKLEPPGRKKLEHELIVFACRASEYEETLARHLSGKAPAEPGVHNRVDDLLLYVVWGDRLGDPNPGAILDRGSRRIVVTAKWTGSGMMDLGTEYRAYGFKLGPLDAGDYGAWIRETTPVDKDGPKLTKTFSFRVEK